MSDFNFNVLSLIDEAVVITSNKKITFLNPPAEKLLGGNFVGKTLSAVFGADAPDFPADDFSVNICINKKNCIVRSYRKERNQFLVIKEVKYNQLMIDEAFLFSMRSSLTVMNMSLEHIRRAAEEYGSKDLLEYADFMNKRLCSVSRLVQNISIVNGIHAQTLHFSPKVYDISMLFQEYTNIAAALLPQVEICFDAPAHLYASVDASLIKCLLANLISNSVLHGKCRKLSIRLLDKTDYVMLGINDDGCGIKGDFLYNIFERYLDRNELSEIGRGAGLGLSAAMGIAQLHGGTMLLETKEGRGTALRISLRKNLVSVSLNSSTPLPTNDTNDFLIGLADCIDEKRFREANSEF